MELSPYVLRLHEHLIEASPFAEDQRRALDLVLRSLDPALRMTLLEALSDAAAEITSRLPEGSVDARLRGRDIDFVVEIPPAIDSVPDDPGARLPAAGAPPRADASATEDGETARITVRLPEWLKEQAEQRAGEAGQSLNAWVVASLRSAADPTAPRPEDRPPGVARRGSRHLSGWL